MIPSNRRCVKSKWVFKIKRDGTFRARIVACGYSQIPGVDFSDNYAPVVNDITFRMLLIPHRSVPANWRNSYVPVKKGIAIELQRSSQCARIASRSFRSFLVRMYCFSTIVYAVEAMDCF